MPAVNYNSPVYSSANPAVGNLFKSEFAQRQAEQQAYDELAKQDTERARIGANSALANAQLRQAQANEDRNYLFRLNDLQDRRQTGDENRALANRQLDIEQKYREGLIAKPAGRTAAENDQFAADSETIANQLNAAYQNKLAVGRSAAKKIYDDTVAGLHFWQSPDKAKQDYERAIAALDDATFNSVQDLATRYYPPASFKVDPFGKKFLPAVSRGASTSPAGQNPAGLGPGPVPSVTAPDPAAALFAPVGQTAPASGGEGTVSFTPRVNLMDMSLPASTPQVAPTPSAPDAANAILRVPVRGGTLEMSPAVANQVEQQLRSGAVAGTILDQLLKSGQARLIPTVAQPTFPQIPLGY